VIISVVVKVLFVGGTGRTGSTILDKILGSLPGWFSGGELAFIWEKGLVQGGRCSCGEPVAECGIWREAIRRGANNRNVDPHKMVAQRKRFWSIHLPLLISQRVTSWRLDKLEDFPANVEALYNAVAEVSGSSVIIDSSKESHYSFILRERTDLDIYFLHLVRDPRAIGYSWNKKKNELGFQNGTLMERRGICKVSAYYFVSNLAAIWIWGRRPERYKILRYEDFTKDPQSVIRLIANFIGEPIDTLESSSGDTFKIMPSHLVWGNPNRFSNEEIHISRDLEWMEKQGRVKSFTLAVLNFPVARIFGYHLNRNGKNFRGGAIMNRYNLLPREGANE